MKQLYVIASCQEWHRKTYERLQTDKNSQWRWVSNRDELNKLLEKSSPRYIFFLHWRWVVPASIWREYECVCFHMTDLPYGRGGSPLQNLIKAGINKTQLTAFRMDNDIDAGPIYAKLPLSLEGRAEDIYIKAGELSFDLALWIIHHHPEPIPQCGEVVSFNRRCPEESILPNDGELGTLYDHIRMLDAPGYPPAFLDYGKFRLEFTRAHLESGNSLRANVIMSKRLRSQ